MLAALLLASLADWPRLFGPDGDSTVETAFPVAWSADDYAWTRPLPGEGHSSPVVFGGRLYLTAGLDIRTRRLLCLDAATGEDVWHADFALRGVRTHRKNSVASSTPAVGEADDGRKLVVALYADAFEQVAVAYDADGVEAWRRPLGKYESQHGQASSPVVDGGRVYLASDQLAASSVVCLDLASGEEAWSTPRKISKTAYATPRLATLAGRRVLVCLSDAEGVSGLDPETGRLLFASGPQPQRVVASPLIVGDAVVVTGGSGGTGKHTECVEVSRDGEKWSTRVRWTKRKAIPYVPTPVAAGGLLFFWNDGGTLTCAEPDSGETLWTERIGGKFSGSPLVAGGRLYAMSEDGVVAVVDAARAFKRHPGGRIEGGSHATPSAAGGLMYLRGFSSLAALPAE